TPLTNKDIIAAQVEPNTVIEKYWPGATEAMKAKGFAVKTKNFWPVTSIRKAKLMLDWEPEDTFEKWLKEIGWVAKKA
ncbi:MAG: hypothetical protein ABI443_07945, partial [Chthoniobacterales bacterium]